MQSHTHSLSLTLTHRHTYIYKPVCESECLYIYTYINIVAIEEGAFRSPLTTVGQLFLIYICMYVCVCMCLYIEITYPVSLSLSLFICVWVWIWGCLSVEVYIIDIIVCMNMYFCEERTNYILSFLLYLSSLRHVAITRLKIAVESMPGK